VPVAATGAIWIFATVPTVGSEVSAVPSADRVAPRTVTVMIRSEMLSDMFAQIAPGIVQVGFLV
jgi:hypothetical protein